MYEKLRLRSPKIVWDEIERLVADYGVDYVWDVADNFTGNKDWLKKFHQESLRRKFRKPFFKIQSRVDDLSDENIVKMLRDLNVVQLFIGFESDDDRRLAGMKKGTTSSMNRKAVANLMKYNLPIRAYLVFGSMGETPKSLAKTVKLAEEIFAAQKENLVAPHIFTPLPGSIAFRLFIKKTGKKYAGQDIINWDDAICDWVKNFSKVSFKDLKETERYLRRMRYDISAYSF